MSEKYKRNQELLTMRSEVVFYDLEMLQTEMAQSVKEMEMPLYNALTNLRNKIDSVFELDVSIIKRKNK